MIEPTSYRLGSLPPPHQNANAKIKNPAKFYPKALRRRFTEHRMKINLHFESRVKQNKEAGFKLFCVTNEQISHVSSKNVRSVLYLQSFYFVNTTHVTVVVYLH